MVRRKFSGKTKTTHTTSKVNRVSNIVKHRKSQTASNQSNTGSEVYSMSNYSGEIQGFGNRSSPVGGLPGIPEVNAEPTTGKQYEVAPGDHKKDSGGSLKSGTYSEPAGKNVWSSDVYFKNLHGKDQNKKVTIKTKFKPSNQDLQILAAMELQKDPAWRKETTALGENAGIKGESYKHGSQHTDPEMKKHVQEYNHGNVFKHLSNKSGDYLKLSEKKQDPSNKNYMWDKRPTDYKPPTYGDRGLTGIGKISTTGFAGGKRGDDPFKFTEPKNRGFKVIGATTKTPQWSKFKEDKIKTKAQYTKQVNDRNKRKNVSWGVIEGSQQKRDNMSLWGGKELPKHEWTNLDNVPNFASPKRAVQDSNMEIYKIDQKKKRDAREAAKKSLADEYADLGS